MSTHTIIPLGRFVDYVMATGPDRIPQIRDIGASDERFDSIYKPIRDAIVDMHRMGLDTRVLDDLVTSAVDPREQRIFPRVVAGYKSFLHGQKRPPVWYEPPARDYPIGSLTVRVAPELGLLLDGRPHAIKLYMRRPPIEPDRAMLLTTLMRAAFGATWPGTIFAVLDVRRRQLHSHVGTSRTVSALLHAEAVGLDAFVRAMH